MLTAVAPAAGTGTVDVTVTTAAGTSPVDTAKDSFTYGTNLALLATASASNTCWPGTGEHHLRWVLTEYLLHYNTARPHRALGQLTPAQAGSRPPDLVNLADHRIHRKQVLEGLIREYYIAALPPRIAAGKRRSPLKSYFRALPGTGAAVDAPWPATR